MIVWADKVDGEITFTVPDYEGNPRTYTGTIGRDELTLRGIYAGENETFVLTRDKFELW
jgi:hypothetical protein